MKKEIRMKLWIYIFMIVVMLIGASTLHYANNINKQQSEQIKQLKQNNIEQAEEKEVYRNRCKMLEDLIEESGLAVDNCDCK